MVVRVSNTITALQHKGERSGRFAARCNELAHIIQGQDKQ